MTWLTRNTSSSSNPLQRMSDPKFDNIKPSRRPLGTGAIIVRTPQEALSGTSTPLELSTKSIRSLHTSLSSPIKHTSPPPCPTRAPPPPPPPPPPPSTTLRPALEARSSDNLTPIPPQPPFDTILLSPLPSSVIDHSKIIVTLETSSATHRTTFRSLISRPSYLANYVTSLLPRKSVAASLYSSASGVSQLPDNSFNAMFHDHLASSGFIPQSSLNIHVFLDRPSAPYAHILSYLRTPLATPEHPPAVPRAVQLASSPRERLQALLELRDEANYLGLQELFKMCNAEISSRSSVISHACPASVNSETSIHSLHTVQEDNDTQDISRSSSHHNGKSMRVAPPPSYALLERSRSRGENKQNNPTPRQVPITSWI